MRKERKKTGQDTKKRFVFVLMTSLLFLLLWGCGADQGEIHEEGRPEQIFANPQKELTRRFIKRLKVLEIEIETSSCDLPGAYSEIDLYCSKNQVPPKTALHIRQIFEELVQQILILELNKQQICFKAEYSDADESAKIIVEYDGEGFDPERVENQLALTLVQNAVSDLHKETMKDSVPANRIIMHLRP